MLDIKYEETMVFGDQLNDVEMMKSAYHSYAMENANEHLKQIARFRAKRNTENGVVDKIKEVIKIGQSYVQMKKIILKKSKKYQCNFDK